MRARGYLWTAALALVAVAGWAGAADAPTDVKDPAELMPEQTLFYCELWDNPQLMKEVQDLLKGSSLQDMPAALARFHDKLGAKDHDFSTNGLGAAGLILSPEMLGEIGRVRGWAFAVTNISKKGEPDFVSVLLTGDSEILPLMFRGYLCMTDGIRSVGEVDGVKIYQDKSPKKEEKPSSSAPMPPFDPQKLVAKTEFSLAMAPGMVVFGSTPDSVKDVLGRVKSKKDSLAKSKGFQSAAKLRENGGGLFFYADLDRLAKLAEDMSKGEDAAQWEAVKTFINPKAFHAVAGSLMLRKGGVDIRVQVNVDTKDAGPLVDLIPDRPANFDLLQYLPADCQAANVIPIPDGEKRWQKLLTLVDAAVKLSGKNDQPLPSAQVEKFETSSGIKVGKDICGKIEGIAIGMPSSGQHKSGEPPFPIIVIDATSADAAAGLEDLIPKLIGGLSEHDAPKTTSDDVDGIKVKHIAGDDLPWHAPLSYGHKGKVIIVAQESKDVAACLNLAGKKKGLLDQPKVATALKDLDKPAIASLWLIGETVRYFNATEMGSGGKDEDKFDQEMKKVVEALPPMLSSLTVKSDRITFEMRQPGLKAVSAKLIDLLIDKSLNEANEGTKTKPIPVPPIP